MKKWLWISVVSLAVLAAGYIALPRYTVAQLEEAARREDVERLQRYIDFPVLRDNLKARVQERLRRSMDDSVPQELNELFTAGTNLFIGPLLQQLVTPAGVGDLLRGGRNLAEFERELYRQPADGGAGGDTGAPADDGEWQLLGWRLAGLNRATADYGSDGDVQLRLFLERRGLRWRLVDIALLQDKSQ